MATRFFVALLILCVFLSYGDCRQPSSISAEHEYLIELDNRLQILNKPAVKTIVSKESVYDCVPIDKQPAFDHPALKNHKIQLHPTNSPLSRSSTSKIGKRSLKLRGTGEACPDGTVPIKRTAKEDLIRSDKQLPTQETTSKNVNVRLENHGKLFGSYVNMALYNPSIANDQESSSEIRLEGGPSGQTDLLRVGWKVSTSLNGDGQTRIFGYWHDGTNNKGCYNTLCPGFVQVDKEISINYLIPPPLSTYGDASQQYSGFFAVDKDPETGNWLLHAGDDSVYVGYWPKELFPNLANGADMIAWGGSTSPDANGNYPPMGNGHLPDGLYKDTCYFDTVTYIDSATNMFAPLKEDTKIVVDSPECYDLRFEEPHETLKILGFSFMFGGPGGKCT